MDLKNWDSSENDTFRVPLEEAGKDFIVTLRYLSKDKMREIAKSCKKVEYQNRHQVFSLDEDKLASKIADLAIIDWEGLTPEAIVKLVPELDIKKIEADLGEVKTVACDAESKKFLTERSYLFSNFIDHFIMDASALQEASLKN